MKNPEQSSELSGRIESGREKIKEIRERAMDSYAKIAAKSNLLRDELAQEFAKSDEERDDQRVVELHSKIEEIEKIGDDLDEIILGSFEEEDKLRDLWIEVQEKTKGWQ